MKVRLTVSVLPGVKKRLMTTPNTGAIQIIMLICGMEICERTVVEPSEYEDTIYYFGVLGREETFDANLEYWGRST